MFRLRIGTRTRRRWTWPSQTNRNGIAGGVSAVTTFFGHFAFFGQPPKCEVAHTSFRLSPPKSDRATSIWRARRGHMALKLAKLATVGIGLAMALTLLTAMTWATAWPAFRPALFLVY